MELTTTYILSQVFVITMYILLGVTYYAKDRKTVLVFNFLSIVSCGIAYIFLSAWTGLAMNFIAVLRNVIFVLDEKKNGKRGNINKKDVAILVILYLITIISAMFNYDGFLSLFSVFATMLYTLSVWQKKTYIYKLLGIPIGILWIVYNIYIQSIFGIVLESGIAISSITGYILETKKKK